MSRGVLRALSTKADKATEAYCLGGISQKKAYQRGTKKRKREQSRSLSPLLLLIRLIDCHLMMPSSLKHLVSRLMARSTCSLECVAMRAKRTNVS